MVIGVTGKYCAGKDTAVRFLRRRGFREIDVDRIGHRVLEEMSRAVAEEFGPSVLTPDGGVDRRRLGAIAFQSKEEMRRLESILHPLMVRRVEEALAGGGGHAAINAAVLFRMGLQKLCDRILCIHAPFPLRFLRALQRDGLPLGATWKRLAAQEGICPKFPSGDVDIYRVGNCCRRKALERRLEQVLRQG
jgi:dephospho-CoA kinase